MSSAPGRLIGRGRSGRVIPRSRVRPSSYFRPPLPFPGLGAVVGVGAGAMTVEEQVAVKDHVRFVGMLEVFLSHDQPKP